MSLGLSNAIVSHVFAVLREMQLPTPADGPDAARQIDPALAPPAGQQHLKLADVLSGKRAPRAASRYRRAVQHTGPHRDRKGSQRVSVKAAVTGAKPFCFLICPLSQRLAVRTQLARGPREGRGHAGAEGPLKHGQGLVAHP